MDDYLASAPLPANVAAQKPRMHGATRESTYIKDKATWELCAEGFCQKGLFKKEMAATDSGYVAHFNDMVKGGVAVKYSHHQYEYAPQLISDDQRVSYQSAKYPWLLAVYRYHNKVNMHHDWDLINIEVPYVKGKGRHYLVHYSSRNYGLDGGEFRTHTCGGNCYNDVIDVNALDEQVPDDLIYGKTTGKFDWVKVDHCQFVDPVAVVSAIHNATDNAEQCRIEMDTKAGLTNGFDLGINIVPSENPDVVPKTVVRAEEAVAAVCKHKCATDTSGQCRAPTATRDTALCAVPHQVWDVAWANPQISQKVYSPLSGPRAGDYVEWKWDDVRTARC